MGCSTSTVSHSNEIHLSHLVEKVMSLNDLPGEVSKPGKSVKFDRVYLQEFVVAVGADDAGKKGTMVNQRSNGDVNTTTLTPEDSFRMVLQTIESYPHILEKKVANKRRRDFGSAWGSWGSSGSLFASSSRFRNELRMAKVHAFREGSCAFGTAPQLQCTWPLCFRYQAISAASCALGPAPKLLFPAWYPIPIVLPEWPCKRTYTRNGRGCVFQTYTVFDLNHRWTTSTQELYSFSQVSLVSNCTHWAFWKLKQQNKIKRICCVSAQESKCVWLGNRTSSAHIAIFV